ncbi:hypothetical protein WQE_15386 [Paraburkholderia hospita]|uniref:Uncharacterized protein n=1 Tax=Paraburkholderia hospita TaxID=169430 RepID=A0ABP2PT79_9BURK|nr:hypothetical protein [Paraburkholderia hospita]EIN00426.1 hypothetical protein WQE_15386 [Paraburkholderia hospita]
MTNEIVLPLGSEYVAVADVPQLIAQLLHPERSPEAVTFSFFIKSAKAGATGEAAKWNGWPIDDDDRQVLERLWGDLPPLKENATVAEVQPYLDRANRAELDWSLDVCWNNASLNSDVLRIDAEREHRKAVVAAIRDGSLKVVAPHTRLPADERQANAEVSVDELKAYVAQFKLGVRVASEPEMPSASTSSIRGLSMVYFPAALPKLSLWDLACLITGQNATDEKPTNETRHQLAALALAVFAGKLYVEFHRDAGFDFVSGFMPSAAAARVDTEWRSLDRVTVRREDWQRYVDADGSASTQPNVEAIRRQETLWDRREPAHLFAGEGFSEELLKQTTLSKYLEFDTWTPETAALLVSGIQAPIPCDAIPEKGAMGLDNCFLSSNLDPFHQARLVLELWRSRECAPARVRPLDFIAWCKTKRIDTSWLRTIEQSTAGPLPVEAEPALSAGQFSAEDRQRFLDAESWNERELLALCLGVPRYADLDEIAPAAEREEVRSQIASAIKSGELPSEPDPDARPGSAVYGGRYQIDPAQAVRWALGKFPRLPEWLAVSKRKAIGDMQQAEKDAAGRYTLHEAAEKIAESGERLKALQMKLCAAAERGELTVHGPGELGRYQYLDGAKARPHYEEAYWDDLNAWLEKFEPRIVFRFAPPVEPTSLDTCSNDDTLDVAEREPKSRPLARQRHQEDEILRVIRELGHDPKALPKRIPGQPWVKSAARDKLTGFGDKVFDLAWERLRSAGDIAEQ